MNTIYGVPVYRYNGLDYVLLSEVPEEQQKALLEWMVGQTAPWIPGLEDDRAIYAWDYERFVEGLPIID